MRHARYLLVGLEIHEALERARGVVNHTLLELGRRQLHLDGELCTAVHISWCNLLDRLGVIAATLAICMHLAGEVAHRQPVLPDQLVWRHEGKHDRRWRISCHGQLVHLLAAHTLMLWPM